MKPGIYPDMPDPEYFAIKAISQSEIKPVLVTPREYLERKKKGFTPTDSMRWGTCMDELVSRQDLEFWERLKAGGVIFDHEAILGDSSCIFDDGGSTNTKKYRDWEAAEKEKGNIVFPLKYKENPSGMRLSNPYKEWKETQEDKVIVPQAWKSDLEIAYSELLSHKTIDGGPCASELLGFGKPENAKTQVVVIWDEPDLGLCKAKLDVLHKIFGIIDLKTTKSADPQEFNRSISKFGYHIQAAWYRHGIKAITGESLDFWIVASQNSFPFRVEIGKFSENTIASGDEEIRYMVDLLKECEKNEFYPNTSEFLNIWELPKYHKIRRRAERIMRRK